MDNSFVQAEKSYNKYQVTIYFEMDESFMSLVPPHRTYINYLINKGVIDTYTVSMETRKSWIIINATGKKEVEELLARSPLYRFWQYDIDEIFVFDGQNYRLPALQMN